MGGWVSESDHLRGLDAVGLCVDASSRAQLLATMLPALHALLASDEASCSTFFPESGRVTSTYGYPTTPDDLPEVTEVWRTRALEHPWQAHLMETHDDGALLLSDVHPGASLLRLPYYADFYRPRGIRWAAYAVIARTGTEVVGVGASRRRRDFTDRERDLLDHVRRPLGAIWQLAAAREHLAALAVAGPDPGHLPRLPGGRDRPALTPAEHQVLQLLLRGWNNRRIAVALYVSPKAVEQHLTHLYRKYAVTGRTQLVLAVVAEPARQVVG